MLSRDRVRRLTDGSTVVLFAFALALPLGRVLLGPAAAPLSSENRRATPMPRLTPGSLGDFPSAFEAFWADRFGFRARLLRWHSVARTRWLGVSPSPKVVIGKDGWLYYAADWTMDDYRGTRPFSPEGLAEWQTMLEARHDWLAARGVHFLLVIAPNAQSIYPEYLPDALGRAGPESRLDQLLGHLAAHSRVTVLDLRTALRAAKTRERIYDRTDTHWNERGAFVGAQEIVRALRRWYPGLEPLAREQFTESVERLRGGDLARLIGLGDAFAEEALLLRPRAAPRARAAEARMTMATLPPRRQPRALETGDPGLPRAVVLRDSFANRLVPFLSEHFARVLYLFTDDLAPAVVERERPDVVIEEFVERRLMFPPPENHRAVADARSAVRRPADGGIPAATPF